MQKLAPLYSIDVLIRMYDYNMVHIHIVKLAKKKKQTEKPVAGRKLIFSIPKLDFSILLQHVTRQMEHRVCGYRLSTKTFIYATCDLSHHPARPLIGFIRQTNNPRLRQGRPEDQHRIIKTQTNPPWPLPISFEPFFPF